MKAGRRGSSRFHASPPLLGEEDHEGVEGAMAGRDLARSAPLPASPYSPQRGERVHGRISSPSGGGGPRRGGGGHGRERSRPVSPPPGFAVLPPRQRGESRTGPTAALDIASLWRTVFPSGKPG